MQRLFFADGVGDPELLAWAMEPPDTPPAVIEPSRWERDGRDPRLTSASFSSPVAGRLPVESRTARIELLLPDGEPGTSPVVVHLAATGDHDFSRRRRLLVEPLLGDGIGAVLLENPFYGRRRPSGQHGASVRSVAELGLMARATIEEARSLLAWLRRRGHRRLGVSGISMGGQMAAMAAASVPFPVATVPCIASRWPASVFTEGELSRLVDWAALERDWGAQAPARLRTELERGDVLRLPPPECPGAAVLVAAEADAYVPAADPRAIHRHWPGSELRWLATGHVGAVVLESRHMVEAVRDAVARLDGCRASAS